MEVIPQIERDLGKPVFSSNQALAWHMEQLAGLKPLLREGSQLAVIRND